jgi:hypothetical protein
MPDVPAARGRNNGRGRGAQCGWPAELAVRFTDCAHGGDQGCRTELSHNFDIGTAGPGTAIYR